jgi:hypothetical protein
MRALFAKLESPVATNLAATFSGTQADVTPAMLPDLYAGEPVVLAAKVKAFKGALKLAATIDGRPWSTEVPLADARAGDGVAKVWARRRVDDVQTERTLGGITDEEADARVEALGLAVYAAHRDTHFAFLGELRRGDEIAVVGTDGARVRFRAVGAWVAPWNASGIDPAAGGGARLALVTCWPLKDGVLHGPLRYVVLAERVTA